MTRKKKISESGSISELLKQAEDLEKLIKLGEKHPHLSGLFPVLKQNKQKILELKDRTQELLIPDRFNEIFAPLGWIAYDSMNLSVMKRAIEIHETEKTQEAETYLAESYDIETIEFHILRFNGHPEFKKRIRLVELAKEDYAAGRFHACVPLILSLIDGLATDVSRHVGFFAEGAKLTAWDCIAAHESGLKELAELMSKRRNKTNDQPIDVPYRNGILHGRELSFDNHLVAAKSWAALFAVRDWAQSLNEEKENPPKDTPSTAELIKTIKQNKKARSFIDAWKPRDTSQLSHLPSKEGAGTPDHTPEREVSEFLSNWINGRYGLMANSLLDFSQTPRGKKAGTIKRHFEHIAPTSFDIIHVDDEAPAISEVLAELVFETREGKKSRSASVRTVYRGHNEQGVSRLDPNGSWKIVENSFTQILNDPSLE